MKPALQTLLLITIAWIISFNLKGQNVGIGTTTPTAKLHIKGGENLTQLLIDANSTQSNLSAPLIRLRASDGTDLMWIHSDNVFNTFIGRNAGRLNDANNGTGNTFIGVNTGFSNVGGYQNTACGIDALRSNVSGVYNTAIGSETLNNNTTGSNNVAMGSYALASNTDGGSNVAIGEFSMDKNTSGGANTAIGISSLYFNTLGANNTAIGGAALYFNSTANENVAIGESALFTQSFSNANTVYDANNVALGCHALQQNQPTTINDGIKNTAVGNYALFNNANGSRNTAIGYNADVTTGNLSNATAIGYNAKVGSSNSLVLGGTGADAVKVGIGTTTPAYPLEVKSATDRTGSFTNTTPSADKYGVYSTCINTPNWGIGTYSEGGYIGLSGQASLNGTGNRYGIFGFANGGSGSNWAIYSSGSSYATGTWQASDEKFKKDIHPVENALDKLKQLAPRAYNFKTAEYSYMGLPGEPQYGFLAQDVEKVFPELVRNIEQPIDHTFKEKDMIQFKGINYTELIPVTIAAIQEQQKTIDELVNQVAALTSQLEAIMSKR